MLPSPSFFVAAVTRVTACVEVDCPVGCAMAEITIRFRHNAATGRRELVVHLESDSDVLVHEHERDHRRLVEQMTGMTLDEDTSVVIERIEKAPAADVDGAGTVDGTGPVKAPVPTRG